MFILLILSKIANGGMKLPTMSTAGNRGKNARSDCFVTIELTDSGGLRTEIVSKVKSLYGDSIDDLCRKELHFFGIENAKVTIEDNGAFDFVLAARIEACLKQLIDTDKEYLLEFIKENKYGSSEESTRFSRLYVPGNSPKLMINAGIHKAHGIILDLEDSVAATKKKEARLLVRNALRQVNFYGAERMVRINQLPKGLNDLDFVIPHNVHVVLLPKSESAEHIKQVNEKIAVIKKARNIKTRVYLIPIIESALGVIRAYDIASAADNIAAMAIGLEDYTADLGARRTFEGNESFFARGQLVNACRAAGIQPLDSVFSDVADMEGLRETVLRSKALGFEGMGCIHPRQIKTIHEGYAPDIEEIEMAKRIVDAFNDATERGLGVLSLGTKMIDPPVVKRAQKVIDIAIDLGMLLENGRGGNG